MDIDNLTQQQLQKALKLCDIMSLQDYFVAATILDTYNWNIQKAIDQISESKENQNKKIEVNSPMKKQENKQQDHSVNNRNYSYYVDFQQDDDPYMMHDNQAQDDMVDYQDYQYQYAEDQFEKKKQMFQQNYVSQLPHLHKTISQPHQMQGSLQQSRLLLQNYPSNRHLHQVNLYKKSQILCQRILQSNPKQKQIYVSNKLKIQTNKRFIFHLYKQYKSRINFTFGTFFLNLIRSYLDQKYLLVFILNQNGIQHKQTKIVERLLKQQEIANFTNKHTISYGMFDNSDDYQIIQKYVQIKDLPAFALFKYNKKEQKQHFVSSYSILNKQTSNVLQWMASSMNINLKKKVQKSQKSIQVQKKLKYQQISSILQDQNLQYQQMQKLYKMHRLNSRLNKQKQQQKRLYLQNLRHNFQLEAQPQFISGQTIQFKFRMPTTGQSIIRVFKQDDKIEKMFQYVECYCQQYFQEIYCQFDLTQTFPKLSLKDKKHMLIKQVFQQSQRENIIVKEN